VTQTRAIPTMMSASIAGAELLILKSIDFSRLSFDVISVEGTGHDPEKDKGVVELLTAKGYTWQEHLGRNDWFVRTGFVAVSETASALAAPGRGIPSVVA
jgi:hypothetical protein